MTNKEIYGVIGNVFSELNVPEKDEVIAFVEKQIASINNKNEKAKARAAAKRAEGDALRGEIEAVLSSEPMTVNDIVEAVEWEGLTPAKVVARMRQLVAEEKAVKGSATVEGRKLVTYTLA